MNKKRLKGMIKESVNRAISSNLTGDEMVTEIMSFDGDNIQLNENMIADLAEKNMSKYQFKFLELRDERYIFIRGQGGTFKWFHFGGNTMIENGDAESAEALDVFIQEKVARGFKVVKMDSGVVKFFKAIGRGIATLLRLLSGIYILAAVLYAIVFLFGGAAALALISTAPISFALITSLGLGAVFLGSGWVMGKVSKKQEVPMASI